MTRSTRFALALIAGISFATAAGARIGSEVLAAPADGGGAPAFRPAAFIPEGEAGIAWLGEQLFFDPRLSSTGTVSCATCHDPVVARLFKAAVPRPEEEFRGWSRPIDG